MDQSVYDDRIVDALTSAITQPGCEVRITPRDVVELLAVMKDVVYATRHLEVLDHDRTAAGCRRGKQAVVELRNGSCIVIKSVGVRSERE